VHKNVEQFHLSVNNALDFSIFALEIYTFPGVVTLDLAAEEETWETISTI